ncbi:hypothetical protein V5799_011103 [Amblyomma americanum]|uniref:EB domain-containing protein n=1 Tax=Amblyomma americanum TaxID=6943 RepID=A0AAQ4EI39_AMBAM
MPQQIAPGGARNAVALCSGGPCCSLAASLLSYGCALDEQCSLRVAHSRCGSDGLCQCRSGYLPLRLDKCLPPAKLDDYCLSEQQCRLADPFSYCKYIIPGVYGKCKCPNGYLLTRANECLPYLESACRTDEDCSRVTRHSRCGRKGDTSVCVCARGFRMSRSKMRCEQDSSGTSANEVALQAASLGQPCNATAECRLRDKHSACVRGLCDCLAPTPLCSARSTGCLNDTFQCRSGECLSWYFVCDGLKNCADGSDESSCVPHRCPAAAFQCDDGTCKSRAAVCNGRWECPDGSDEARCYRGVKCDRAAFRCRSGQCVPQYALCNAVVDCADGSDEDEQACVHGQRCPETSFRCANGACRSSAILCSGVDGCGDNSDEAGCRVCQCARVHEADRS